MTDEDLPMSKKVRRPHYYEAGKLDAAIGHYRPLIEELNETNPRAVTVLLGSILKHHLTPEAKHKLAINKGKAAEDYGEWREMIPRE